jgi:hypothetical protein
VALRGRGRTNAVDPIRYQGDLKIAGRAAAIWAPLPFLRDYQHDPAKRSMAPLWTRVADLSPLSHGSMDTNPRVPGFGTRAASLVSRRGATIESQDPASLLRNACSPPARNP